MRLFLIIAYLYLTKILGDYDVIAELALFLLSQYEGRSRVLRILKYVCGNPYCTSIVAPIYGFHKIFEFNSKTKADIAYFN